VDGKNLEKTDHGIGRGSEKRGIWPNFRWFFQVSVLCFNLSIYLACAERKKDNFDGM